MTKGNTEEHGKRSSMVEKLKAASHKQHRGFMGDVRQNTKNRRNNNEKRENNLSFSSSVKTNGFCKAVVVENMPEIQDAIYSFLEQNEDSKISVEINHPASKILLSSSEEEVELTTTAKICVIW